MRILRFAFAAALFASLPAAAGAQERWIHTFDRIDLQRDVFYAEGATFGDVTGDGKADVIAGPFIYLGPDFKEKRELYPPKPYDIKGYSDNFFPFVYDFNGDGWPDIFLIGFPGKDASWFENPKNAPGHWKRHVVFDEVDNESPTFVDLNGDGRPDLVCITRGDYGYAEFDPKDPAKPWPFTPISEGRKLGNFTHGMGVGDINGDGKADIMERQGWYEQPASLSGKPLWKHHPYPFAQGGGAQMYAYDLDGDGDADVISSLNAHGFGLSWHEQVKKDGEITFIEHKIMGKTPEENDYGVAFAQLHAIDLIDMDGDGVKDIVTGKRIWAHYGEPSAEKPSEAWWFKVVRGGSGRADFIPYKMDSDSGVGVQVVAGDLNGDGLPDVVVSNKLGTFVLIHKRRHVGEEEWKKAQPRKVAMANGLKPEEAALAMTVPDGFKVDLVAGEPRVNQPIAFTVDPRGRLWVAEAYTYPLRVGGKAGRLDEGKDRIVIFEDADGDGVFETRKVFAEHLNLVSGLEVGFGGVWVGAAPYFFFIPDRNQDDQPDGPPEVLLDGFGLEDTHETLNSFIWGPDGWLYGCHGVFTHSLVGKPGTPKRERTPLNAGVWRYHPIRREFEVFAWGTSNPWGVDFNDQGQAFLTACVIPHLYHMIQGGRYFRQGGRHFDEHAYDDLKTIADHLHYTGDIGAHAWWGHEPLASGSVLEAGGGHAHCGAMVYLGDAFPEKYRGQLFMNNIHGNRVNVDILERQGSGFVGKHGKDFIIANDRWYRGINLKTGPSGEVYFIDWYDKNACHRVQPEIWDRESGRIYRVSYGDRRPAKVDLAKLSDLELAKLTLHRNEWQVRTARRLLEERGPKPEVHAALAEILRTNPEPDRQLRALWTLHATGGLSEALTLEELRSPHEYLRAWAIQLSLEGKKASKELLARLEALSRVDPSPVVRLYLASALQRLPAEERWGIAEGLLAHGEDATDHNLPLLIWYGVEPLAAREPRRALELGRRAKLELVTRFIARRVASNEKDLEPIAAALAGAQDAGEARLLLSEMLEAFKGRANLTAPKGWAAAFDRLAALGDPQVAELLRTAAVKFGDRRIFPELRRLVADPKGDLEKRRSALAILREGKDPEALAVLEGLLADASLRAEAIRGLAAYDDPSVPAAILARYGSFSTPERADAVSTLAARPAWARALLGAIRDGKVERTDLGAFTVRQLRGFKDAALDELLGKVWGEVREASEDKLALIAEWKGKLKPERLAGANLPSGRDVFQRTCAACHTLFGEGAKIAPDLTGSNRANLDYILENLIDPNAVVGKDYLMTVLFTRDGRAVSGLILRETESAITMRTPTEEVVVALKDIQRREPTTLSLMPEDQIAALKGDEARDLIAYLASPAQVPLPGEPGKIDPATKRVAGALEGEKLKVLKTPPGSAGPQEMSPFGAGLWSGNDQLWWTGAKPGDRLLLEIPVAEDGTYRLDAALTRANDYGIVQFLLDGKRIGGPIDLYNDRVVPTGSTRLGEFPLAKGKHVLGVEIVGANAKAIPAHMFGLDYVLLSRKSA